MKRVETLRPGAGSVSRRSGSCASWTIRARRAASSRASLTVGSSVSRAWSMPPAAPGCARGRRRRSVGVLADRRAATDADVLGDRPDESTARSTSRAARGSTPSRAAWVRPAAPRPRRSMWVVTGLAPLSEVTRLVYERPHMIIGSRGPWRSADQPTRSRRWRLAVGVPFGWVALGAGARAGGWGLRALALLVGTGRLACGAVDGVVGVVWWCRLADRGRRRDGGGRPDRRWRGRARPDGATDGAVAAASSGPGRSE